MYPFYYRKGPVCIKRESPISGKQVNIDEAEGSGAFRVISVSNKNAFDQMVSDMEIVSFEIYERYLILLHKRSQIEARSFRDSHHNSPEFTNGSERRQYEEW